MNRKHHKPLNRIDYTNFHILVRRAILVVAPVEKANVLAMLDEVTSLEDVHKLAGDEDVEKWQSAIGHPLIN
ncbi:MAG: hypothetical protein ACYTXT_38800 [Nostoc sp.]